MKTNQEKGQLFIEMDCNNRAIVVFHSKDGTVWVNRNELCELFGVYKKIIDKLLDDILDTMALQIDDLCRYHRYVKSGKISFDITEVNLEVIIILAFQLKSPQANLLRKWFVERCLKSRQLDLSFVEAKQNYAWN